VTIGSSDDSAGRIMAISLHIPVFNSMEKESFRLLAVRQLWLSNSANRRSSAPG
jgi:hypothetical protein